MAAFSSVQPFMLDSDSLVFPPNNPFSILDQVETPCHDLDQISTKVLAFGGASSSSPMDPSSHQKRKNSAQSKERKGKKQKKMEKNKDSAAVPTGYIHVRARRGQATDSHSLAERVRREKISERMKLLQSLVPGCDKVTGKALMLDEIINYVQSLQYQTEFLSMKLASLNPIRYDFGMGLESFVARTDEDLISGNSDDPLLWQQAQIPDVFFPSI